MNSRKTEDSMALLGGVLLGAAVMYYMDPERGQRRRQRITSAAEGVLDDALGRARHIGSHLGNQVSDAQNQAAAYADHLADRAHQIASDVAAHEAGHVQSARRAIAEWKHAGGRLWNRARGWAKHAPDIAADRAQQLRDELLDRTDGWRKDAAGGISRASHQAQSWLGHDERHGLGAGTVMTSTAGCLLTGAGLMYFMDSKQGRARRASAVRMTTNCIHRTGAAMHEIGNDIARWFGRSESRAREFVNRNRLDTEQLIRGIRSEIRHLSNGANQVQFMADADGTVTITGNLDRNEVDEFLTALHRVPGVEHVINRLSITESAGRSTSASSAAQWQ